VDADLSSDSSSARIDTDADLSRNSSGAELKADADLSRSSSGAELKADASASRADADLNVDISKDSAGADRQAKPGMLSFNDLPQAVQAKIRDMSDDSNYMKVRKTTKDGQTFYEVKFKEFRISEDGTIMEK
jgi:hypothetical protein